MVWCVSIPLDPRDEAARLSVANVNVTNATGLQEPLYRAFNLICRRTFTDDDPAVFAVGFQSQRETSQFFGKGPLIVIARARFCMNFA